MSDTQTAPTEAKKTRGPSIKDLTIAVLTSTDAGATVAASLDRSKARKILKEIAGREADFPSLVEKATAKTAQGRRAFTEGEKNYKAQANPNDRPVLRLPVEGLGVAVGGALNVRFGQDHDGVPCMIVRMAAEGAAVEADGAAEDGAE